MSRPEHIAPPEVFYNDDEAVKYTQNSRVQAIQAEMTERCLELLALPPSATDPDRPQRSMLLDIGCGSGLSGEILDEEGHAWCGCDISASMLAVALDREVEGDLFLQDIGQGFGFRAGAFDGAISVSVLQWLCNADASSHSPPQRLERFFNTLFASLARGARAVFQFYPESDDQVLFIMKFATRAGFGGGLVVDYPNSKKARKCYLVLQAGQDDTAGRRKPEPSALGVEEDGTKVAFEKKRKHEKKRSKHAGPSLQERREYIKRKKDSNRRKGQEGIPRDSKYTGRKRKQGF